MELHHTYTLFLLFLFLIAGKTVCANEQDQKLTPLTNGGFRPTKLFVFGDSYSDTGNNPKLAGSWKPPYGVTFPGKPAGRYSDGRVLTDYVAKFMGIKSPLPYQWRKYGQNRLQHGINFAYGGTGVFDTGNLEPNMSTQIGFLEDLIQQSVYTKWDLESALALVTVSGNDYAAYTATGGADQLSSTNYLYWLNQMVPLLTYQNLFSHVDGSSVAPSPTLSDDKISPNPAYESWKAADQRCIILLNASLTEEAVSIVVGLTSARAMWIALEAAYSNSSTERVQNLRDQLRFTVKGDKSVAEFGRIFKTICDNLTAIGHPIDATDQIHWFLCGLGPSFEMFSTSIRSVGPLPSFSDLVAKAEGHELFIKALHASTPSGPTMAFSANHFSGQIAPYLKAHQNAGPHEALSAQHSKHKAFHYSSSSGNFRNSSRNRSQFSKTPGQQFTRPRRPPHCQLCRTQGHYASACPNLHSYASAAPSSDDQLAQAFHAQCHVQALPSFISHVVNQMAIYLKRIRDTGVRRVIVTTLQPIGCLPRRTIYSSYQQCNETDNSASNFHNQLLQRVVTALNNNTKDYSFLVLDLFSSFNTVLKNKGDFTGSLKFDTPLKPCCVGIKSDAACGSLDEKGRPLYTVCNEPESAFFWDLVHPTEAGWRAVYLTLRSSLNRIYY